MASATLGFSALGAGVAAYDFRTITSAEALAFNGASDTLRNPIMRLDNAVVDFNDTTHQVAITDVYNHQTVTFGSGIYGALLENPLFGGALRIGSPGADTFSATPGTNGNGPVVVVHGGAGDDTLIGIDYMYGDAGHDLFVPDEWGDRILDWETVDSINLGRIVAISSNYVETSQPDIDAAIAFAKAQVQAGIDYVVVAVGADLHIFTDRGENNMFTSSGNVTIVGRGLGDISVANIVGGTKPVDPSVPVPPPYIPGSTVTVGGNMDAQHLSSLLGAPIEAASATGLSLKAGDLSLGLQGQGFTYDANQQITGGTVSTIFYRSSTFTMTISTPGVSAANFGGWVATDATQQAFATILATNDHVGGLSTNDLLRGYGGNDIIWGAGGSDSLFGGDGDDEISALYPSSMSGGGQPGPSYLRGEAGNDTIFGGPQFDDIHGNTGDDSERGAAGDDWVVGGQGHDQLHGDAGFDIVYGNLGNDTIYGDDGADWVRGGQGDDSVSGGNGDDWLWGDRGGDTISGGAGADIFYSFGDAGLDRVTDFSFAEGDRVRLDAGTSYTVSQVGADTVVAMAGGGQLVLVGVSQASLGAGWIAVG